jgi:hypothetical protein
MRKSRPLPGRVRRACKMLAESVALNSQMEVPGDGAGGIRAKGHGFRDAGGANVSHQA